MYGLGDDGVKDGGDRGTKMVPEAGFEPARPSGHALLRGARLPLLHSGAFRECYMSWPVPLYIQPTRGRPARRFAACPSGARNFSAVARLRSRHGSPGA